MPLITWDGWLDNFEPWRAKFDKKRDLFGFPYAEIDGIQGYWIKESERQSLPYGKIETMMEALKPIDN